MKKETISVFTAEKVLNECIEDISIEDAIYTLANDIVNTAVKKTEDEYQILDANGEPYEDDGEAAWYDEYRENARELVYEKIRRFVTR